MYKVFFNDSFLIISDYLEVLDIENSSISEIKKFSQINSWLDEVEESSFSKNIYFRSVDIKKDWKTFVKKFKLIAAAGGLVQNNDNKYLLIFRRGKWDLPKGKIDKGETIENAAIREVMEETGLQNIHLVNSIGTTYHIYRTKGKLAIKPTYWYLMKCIGNEMLVPQRKEDIEKAQWISIIEIKAILRFSFSSIQEILVKTLDIK